jgi:hypothetical protein
MPPWPLIITKIFLSHPGFVRHPYGQRSKAFTALRVMLTTWPMKVKRTGRNA